MPPLTYKGELNKFDYFPGTYLCPTIILQSRMQGLKKMIIFVLKQEEKMNLYSTQENDKVCSKTGLSVML